VERGESGDRIVMHPTEQEESLRYNNNTSSGHIRDQKVKHEALYAEERKERAWLSKLNDSRKQKKVEGRD